MSLCSVDEEYEVLLTKICSRIGKIGILRVCIESPHKEVNFKLRFRSGIVTKSEIERVKNETQAYEEEKLSFLLTVLIFCVTSNLILIKS